MSDVGKLIMEITRNVERDHSPLQLVSADVLAYYRACVAELKALKSVPQKVEQITASPEKLGHVPDNSGTKNEPN